MKTKPVLFLAILFFIMTGSILLSACNRGSEVENEFSGGKIFLADGKPAIKATVKFFPVSAVPQDSSAGEIAYATKTDAKGRYTVDTLLKGEYNILASLDDGYAYDDSVFIRTSNPELPSDTLGAPASYSGIVSLEPFNDPRSATVQVLGTNTFANVDRNGRFTLANLGAGKYSMRVVTTAAGYTPLFAGFRVNTGEKKQAKDTLRLAYTAIPSVRGIKATYDTLTSTVILTWNAADYGKLSDYLVFRDPASNISPSFSPIANTSDTVFKDVLAPELLPDFGSQFLIGEKLDYRVIVRGRTLETGPFYEKATITAAPRSLVETILEITFEGGSNDSASIGDSVRAVLHFGNPTRKLTPVQWFLDGSQEAFRTLAVSAWSGVDAIVVPCRSVGTVGLEIAATDVSGSVQRSSYRLHIVKDPPVADAGPDTLVEPGSAFTFRDRSRDRFGRIVKREWDIGAKGTFVTVSGPDTLMQGRAPTRGTLACILRDTDDDGQSSLDTMTISVLEYLRKSGRVLPAGDFPRNMYGAESGGRIYFLEGRSHFEFFKPYLSMYDPATDTWSEKEGIDASWPVTVGDQVRVVRTNLRSTRIDPVTLQTQATFEGPVLQPYSDLEFFNYHRPSMGSFNGRLYVIDETQRSRDAHGRIFSMDPGEGIWRDEPPLPPMNHFLGSQDYSVAFLEDRILAMPGTGDTANYRFDPVSRAWSRFKRNAYGDIPFPLATANGILYCYNLQTKTFVIYDAQDDRWLATQRPDAGYFQTNIRPEDWKMGMHVHGGKIYGFFSQPDGSGLAVFSRKAGMVSEPWTRHRNIPIGTNDFQTFLVGNKVYLVVYPEWEPCCEKGNEAKVYEYLLDAP